MLGLASVVIFSAAAVRAAGRAAPEKSADAGEGFVDDCGRVAAADQPARRIISLYSAHTENLFALGLDEEVIGVGRNEQYPTEALEKPVYDYRSDPEKVIAAAPDLVLIRPFIEKSSPDFTAALRNAGVRVVCLYPEAFDQFGPYIMKLAALTGTAERAELLLDDFRNRLAAVSETVSGVHPRVGVYFEATGDPYRTITPDSLPARAIELAGGRNVAQNAVPARPGTSIAPFGAERLLELADRIDVYVAQRGRMNPGVTPGSIAARPGFYAIKAVSQGRVYVIDEKLVSSPTFRFARGVEVLAHLFYPQVFSEYSSQ